MFVLLPLMPAVLHWLKVSLYSYISSNSHEELHL